MRLIFDPVNTPNKDAGWDEIETDLQFAIDNLPESFPNEPGRATKYAAMVTKAHAHLFQGSMRRRKLCWIRLLTVVGLDWLIISSITLMNGRRIMKNLSLSSKLLQVVRVPLRWGCRDLVCIKRSGFRRMGFSTFPIVG